MLAVDDVGGRLRGAGLAQGLEVERWVPKATIAQELGLREDLLVHGAVLTPLFGIIALAESALDVSPGLLKL